MIALPDLPLPASGCRAPANPRNRCCDNFARSRIRQSALAASHASIHTLLAAPPPPSRPCFIRQFILQGLPVAGRVGTLPPAKHSLLPQRLLSRGTLAGTLSLGMITTALIIFGQDLLKAKRHCTNCKPCWHVIHRPRQKICNRLPCN